MVPIVSIVGRSGSGKTTLIERIIPKLKAKGYKVGTIKHDAHHFEIDHNGKDTWRMANSGADVVAISSKNKMAMVKLLEAEKNERDLHKKEEQLYDLRHELEGLVERKKALAVAMDRFERLYPAKRMLKSIDELTQSCGNIDRYDILPDDPAAAVSDIEKKTAEMESSLSDLDLQRQKALENINACTDRDVSISSHSLDINSIVKSYSQIESDISSSHDLAVQMEGFKSRLIERGELLFKGGWVPGYAEMLRKLDVQALRDSIDAFSGADDDCREQEARIAGLKARAGARGKTKYIPFLAGAFFLAGTAGIALMSRSLPGYISAIFMAVGVCMLVMWQLLKGGNVSPADMGDAEAFLGKRRRDRESFLKEVNESLYGLSIAQKRIMSPGDSLLVDINMLRDLLRSYEDAAERKRVVNRRLQEKAGAIDRLFAECSLEHRLSMLDDIVMLEGLLDEAESRRKAASSSRQDIQDIDRSMEVIKEQLQKAAVRKKHIIDMLNTIEGPDLEQKVKTLAARRGMRQRAQTLREELDRNYPKPESILREEDTASIAQLLEPDAAAAAKTDMEDLDRRINDLNSRMGALRNELERSRNDESLSDIRGQIEAVNKERRIIGYKRDRLILVKNLILEADRLFREENKPDILKKTGDFLGIITDGKYDHVFSSEGGSGLTIRGEGFPIKADYSLSRGTLEQLFLALRLAIADHLDEGRETLPMFLDEALVNWDGIRLDGGLKLLMNISEKRQVFIFTCHKWMTDRIVSATGAQVVEIQKTLKEG
jgi:uncharacterized protein YhaN